MTDINATTFEVLSDEALEQVIGGLNPQPLPPGPAPEIAIRFASLYSRFAINQHLAFQLFRPFGLR